MKITKKMLKEMIDQEVQAMGLKEYGGNDELEELERLVPEVTDAVSDKVIRHIIQVASDAGLSEQMDEKTIVKEVLLSIIEGIEEGL